MSRCWTKPGASFHTTGRVVDFRSVKIFISIAKSILATQYYKSRTEMLLFKSLHSCVRYIPYALTAYMVFHSGKIYAIQKYFFFFVQTIKSNKNHRNISPTVNLTSAIAMVIWNWFLYFLEKLELGGYIQICFCIVAISREMMLTTIHPVDLKAHKAHAF